MLRHKLLLLAVLLALRANAWAADLRAKIVPRKGKFKDVEVSFALAPEGMEARLRQYSVVFERDWLTISKAGNVLLKTPRKAASKQALIKARGGVIEIFLDGHFEASAVDPEPSSAAGEVAGPAAMTVRELGPGTKPLRVSAPAGPVSGKVALKADAPGAVFHVDGMALPGGVWDTAAWGNGPHVVTAVKDGEISPGVLFLVENDVRPPQILDLTLAGTALTWRTDEKAECVLELDGSNVPVAREGGSAVLPVLMPETEHKYRLICEDESGNVADSGEQSFTMPPAEAAQAEQPAAAAPAAAVPAAAGEVKAPQKFLSPALADGINDEAVFGPAAREISIMDARGRLIVKRSRGGAALTWDGRNEQGAVVDSGVYIARITAYDGTSHYQSFAIVK